MDINKQLRRWNDGKHKNRNRMTTTHLDSVMRVAIEGPTKNFEFILHKAISLWKDSRKFRSLLTNLEKYLARIVEVESKDGEDFHPQTHLNFSNLS